MMTRKYALVAVGELLADLIGTEFTQNLADTEIFKRFQGGSPANLAANMARLGNSTALVACVGNDNVGTYLVEKVAETGVDTTYIGRDTHAPTSIVLVSRTKGTPDFIAYRTADRMIQAAYIPDDLLQNASFFHTTCFALSQEPAQSVVVAAAARAQAAGCIVSLDANYAPSIWPDRAQAQQTIQDYCQNGAFVKLSEDDAERIFGQTLSNDAIIAKFHQMGAQLVCLTLGGKGSIVSSDYGKNYVEIAGKPIEVKDATGAGDSYWSGFLTAWLDSKSPAECAQAGANIAALKISTVGPLPAKVDRAILYS
ncbi:carbohydrate kinase [Runella sp. CRIBMP]|uniref:carbohydrate kinase family protein n=1 Tax=Runella sp. CRIBMP TaxID=2683261 RepID=UPI00141270EB|nr:sugar kinase [Runella sp. CRIBMP]NBB18045.1 carbohydrate kinase [Runella sp. CRIBMP]